MEWKPVAPDMPSHNVLLWVEGRCVIGCRLEGVAAGGRWQIFMATGTDALLPLPSHWMPLPEAPRNGPARGSDS